MKEHTGNRLKTIMAERKLKQVDILKAAEIYKEKYGVKITKQDLSHYVNGRVEPGQDKLYILAKVLDVNEGWLMGFDVDRRRIPDEERGIIEESLVDKISNAVLQLSPQNQQDVYDFAEMKLTKQREANVIELSKQIRPKDPTMVVAAHRDGELTDEVRDCINDLITEVESGLHD